jgi:dimethylargininase
MPKTALVRRPGPRLDEGIVTTIARRPVDYQLGCEQWARYVEGLAESGWDIVEVPPADDCPDAVFVEDTVVMYANVAVITHPGAQARRAEVHAVEKVVEDLGCSLARITAPGTLDGGDVLKVGETVYVGRGGRTNAEGVAQLRAILGPLGATVVAVPIERVLHLKSAVTALPDGTILGYGPLVDRPAMFPRFLEVDEEAGSHVVDLGEGRLLMAAGCPKSVGLVADLGYRPVVVDISEFEKLEGCVTCLSVRLRDLAP